jgi:hypothetical protein
MSCDQRSASRETPGPPHAQAAAAELCRVQGCRRLPVCRSARPARFAPLPTPPGIPNVELTPAPWCRRASQGQRPGRQPMSGCCMCPRLQPRPRRAEIKRIRLRRVEPLLHRPPPAEAERGSYAGLHHCAPHVACALWTRCGGACDEWLGLVGLLETEPFRSRETRQTKRRLCG